MFQVVLEAFEPLWLEAEVARLSRPDRRRAIGAGNKGKLAMPERVLLAVMFLRHHFALDFLGLLFDLNKSNVSRGLDLTLPVLERALPGPIRARTLQALPDEPPRKSGGGGGGGGGGGSGRGAKVPRRKKIGTMKEFLEQFPELEDLVIDSTEQERGQPKPARKTPAGKRPAGRPVDKRKFYSSKAGAHTLKVQLAVTVDGYIVHQSATTPGKMHDAMVLRRSRLGWGLPSGVRLWGDKGYVGMEKVYPWLEVVTPTKRLKGKDLTEEARDFNKQVAKVRICVENAICRVRKYRACGEFYRGRTDKHGLRWGVACGLVNLRHLDAAGRLEA